MTDDSKKPNKQGRTVSSSPVTPQKPLLDTAAEQNFAPKQSMQKHDQNVDNLSKQKPSMTIFRQSPDAQTSGTKNIPQTIPPAKKGRSLVSNNNTYAGVPSSKTAASTPFSNQKTPSSPNVGKVKKLSKRVIRKRIIIGVLCLILTILIAVPVGIFLSLNSRIHHIAALSTMVDSHTGSTWLIAGSDARDGAISDDGTTGMRTDTIMLLHKATNGHVSLISIPRDTLVTIPDNGDNKINAAYAFGGAKLLVKTVENLTNIKIDHYIEVEMMTVKKLVDAVGGVRLCSDLTNIDDSYSGLKWNGGCHKVQGQMALAFSRMRYQDPKGDIGRAERQRQVIKEVFKEATAPANIINLPKFISIADAALDGSKVDKKATLFDLMFMALDFKVASGSDGTTGTPPIADMGFSSEVGSCVLLDSTQLPKFWEDFVNGTLPKGKVNVIE